MSEATSAETILDEPAATSLSEIRESDAAPSENAALDAAPPDVPTQGSEPSDSAPQDEPTAIANAPAEHVLWLTARDQRVLFVCCVLTVIWFAYRVRDRQLVDRSELILQRDVPGIGYRININTASWPEFTQLDGVGPALAQRITQDREERGPFKSLEDLQRVHGIGPKTIEKNRQWMKVGTVSATH